MILKVVILFLVAMGVLAMFGKLTRPGGGRIGAAGQKRPVAGKCPKCGRHRIGKGPCPCGAAGNGTRKKG